MALSHNAFIRGFNTIYQQAPRLTDSDKKDFAEYCTAWVDTVLTHHHYEETDFFPNVNKAAGRTDLMAGAVHEHDAFQTGLQRFKAYLQDAGAGFGSGELIRIMDSFKEPLHKHLSSEPGEIVALAKYSTPENPIDVLAIADAAGKSRSLLVSSITHPGLLVVSTAWLNVNLRLTLHRQEGGHTAVHVQYSTGISSQHGNHRI